MKEEELKQKLSDAEKRIRELELELTEPILCTIHQLADRISECDLIMDKYRELIKSIEDGWSRIEILQLIQKHRNSYLYSFDRRNSNASKDDRWFKS